MSKQDPKVVAALTANAKELQALNKTAGGKMKAEGGEPETDENNEEEEKKDDGEKTVEATLEDHEARIRALEDNLEEKNEENAKLLAALDKSTRAMAAAASKFSDPAWAQAFSRGQEPGTAPAASKDTDGKGDILAQYDAMPAGKSKSDFLLANAAAINAARNKAK